jgi:hypothetical protein
MRASVIGKKGCLILRVSSSVANSYDLNDRDCSIGLETQGVEMHLFL